MATNTSTKKHMVNHHLGHANSNSKKLFTATLKFHKNPKPCGWHQCWNTYLFYTIAETAGKCQLSEYNSQRTAKSYDRTIKEPIYYTNPKGISKATMRFHKNPKTMTTSMVEHIFFLHRCWNNWQTECQDSQELTNRMTTSSKYLDNTQTQREPTSSQRAPL